MTNCVYQEAITVHGESGMLKLGAHLACLFPEGGLITLEGQLGAGKTTLVRGLLRKLGYPGAVKSPTYTLVEPYYLAGRDIYHFDLYRLGEPDELEEMGFRDYLQKDALCLLEWPDRGEGYVPEADLRVMIKYINDESRNIYLESNKAIFINGL